jgi:hypothetical protein
MNHDGHPLAEGLCVPVIFNAVKLSHAHSLSSVIVIAHCNVGGNPTCEFGNAIGRGNERIRGCVLESTRTRNAMDGAMTIMMGL